jgi:hypothetical protein
MSEYFFQPLDVSFPNQSTAGVDAGELVIGVGLLNPMMHRNNVGKHMRAIGSADVGRANAAEVSSRIHIPRIAFSGP